MILGIDVGGTHTDAVLMDGLTVVKKAKVRTDEENLLASLLAATNELVDSRVSVQLHRVVLSTTLSTNAIVQNKIDRVGLLLISGPGLPPQLPVFEQDSCFLTGYTNHRGRESACLDDGQAANAIRQFRAMGINHLGIVGKFSPRNPHQEMALGRLAADQMHHISFGHRLSGHLNFPRRIATTYLNEAVWNRYRRFATEVLNFAAARGIGAPICILKADGGTIDIRHSVEFPAQTILSGPAASVMGILALAGCQSDAIALDIGGTTTDIVLFADGAPLMEPFGATIEGHKTLIRGLRTRSIGIGGDSVVDYREGELQIGPRREGIAAALGGPFPTPTDAMILLGMTDIGCRDRAAAALQPIAAAMGAGVNQAATAIFRETCRKISVAVRALIDEINNQPVYTIHELLEGRLIRPRTLYVVGGPAQAMAPELSRLLACEPCVPAHAEAANAIGAALARTTAELTLLADTEQRLLTIAEEGFQCEIPSRFTREDAIRTALAKLREKASRMGAAEQDMDLEVLEAQEYNMVREFRTTGKNIRVTVQIKPGVIGSLTPKENRC
jgi:N-methylhydantoinase A/oxoprolinase/acetone carboxylase beta subunit